MAPPGDEDDEDGQDGEGRDLWAYVTRSVKPLRDRPADENPARRPATKRRARQESPAALLPAGLPTPEPKSREVDRRTAERLRRGRLPIEARLDLHGMSRPEAHQALQEFIARCYEAGFRHVLVITGKGTRRGEPGVLRQCVPEWLEEKPLREIVLRHEFARRHHGGEGALYILLRRKR